MRHDGKTVAVTGAASGIGLATALRFARDGANVGLMDRDTDRLRRAEALVEETGVRTLRMAGSVTDSTYVNDAIGAFVESFGDLHCVVNSAGIVRAEAALDVAPETFREQLEVNLVGSWLPTQAAARHMARRGGGGAIVLIGSVYGASGAPNRTAYCASKGGVHNLTQSLAVEWGPLGIRVNCVAPTGVRTPMVQDLIDRGIYNMRGVEARTPLGRIAEADEVAAACSFLAGEDASMITGHVLAVDGGWLANGYTTTG